ncbi:MAG TPA: ATP-binding protein, partial [Pyrinomonadaceae bacterium]
EKFRETSKMLATSLERHDFTNEELQKITEAGNLTRIEVLSKTNQTLALHEKTLPAGQKAELDKIIGLVKNGRLDEPPLRDGIGFDAALADFSDGRKLIVISNLYSEENVSQLVENALAEFDKLKEKQINIRQVGFLTLGVLTFLLIFASSWTAVYIARGLTVPIKALAEGADEIARGNLAHRVEVLAEDELALLVASFNQMSAKLEENSAELEERRRYTETVLQSLSTGVISFDASNRVTTINKAAVNILKLETADFAGFELKQLITEENRVVIERLLNRARRIGQAAEQTVLLPERGDKSAEINANTPVALTATALPKTFGESSGIVLVIEDLSELISAQRASAWAEVARRMAHEIKNPLTPIQLSAERISKNFKKTLEANGNEIHSSTPRMQNVIDESTSTILREVNSLKSMVDEFSRFARLPNVRLENGNLNEIIKQAADLYEDRFTDVSIELQLAANLPNSMIDQEQLKRVFVNLIENGGEAFDASQKEKRICLKTFYDKARDLIVAEVSDNGKGIAPIDLQKLFQPYFSTKGRGTGLGLAIVQRIVSEHRGKIRAVNNSTKGAKFIVELPVIV